jgi:hypothetical protein
MGVDIAIYYRDASTGQNVSIEVPHCYSTLGSLLASKEFWSIPKIVDVGIELLAELGKWSSIFIEGWEKLGRLGREIALLAAHSATIDYDPQAKASWFANLTFCHLLLIETAPRDSTPVMMLG